MASLPIVSVILPFRDERGTLEQALRSLERQSLTNFEVLCLDDGSRDGSSSVARKWAGKDPRFHWIRLERRGLVPALNEGIRAARAPFLARMDADDISHPQRLAEQFKYLAEHPEVGVVGSLVKGFPARVIRAGYRRYLEWINGLVTPAEVAREIFVESPMPHPSVLMRSSVVKKLGGYLDIDGPEDYDLWLRCFLAGVSMAKVPRALLLWRDHPNRLSRTDPRYDRRRFWELKSRYLASYLGKRRDLSGRPVFVWGQRLAGRLARRLMRAGISLQGFVNINPEKQGGTRLGLPIYPPQILSRTRAAFAVCAVSVPGAREKIRSLCGEMGMQEGPDYLMAG